MSSREQTKVTLSPKVLEPLRGTALFYPCSGNDTELPIKLCAPYVADFYFVDLKRPKCPQLPGFARMKVPSRQKGDPDVFVHDVSGDEFGVHRRQHRAEDHLDDLPELGAFFFRGDNPVVGEGSSGVLWLGGDLFSRVLTKLLPGGLVVTDGSNPGPNGPSRLSDFYHNRKVGRAALSFAVPFDYEGRRFTCVAYAGEKNGPTLVWRVQ
jgi:hypothetical protein